MRRTRQTLTAVLVTIGAAAIPLVASPAVAQIPPDTWTHYAIGVPHEDIGTTNNAGVVNLMRSDGWSSAFIPDLGRVAPDMSTAMTLRQGQNGFGGTPEPGDRFGEAVVFGDFNGDTFPDLVIGAPGEDIGTVANAGVVHVSYGEARDDPLGDVANLHQGSPGVPGKVEAGDRFGHALAAGDLDGDGFEELIVGVPYEDLGSKRNGGAVYVFWGTDDGLDPVATVLTQNSEGIGNRSEAGDRFGYAVAARQSLAIGAPGEDIGDASNAGLVQVVDFRDESRTRHYHQNSPGVPGKAQSGDRLGESVAYYPYSNVFQIRAGAPGENVEGRRDAGVVMTFDYEDEDANVADVALFHQGTPGVSGVLKADTRLGASLGGDLAGLPGAAPGGNTGAGATMRLSRTGSGGLVFNQASSDDLGNPIPGGNQPGDNFGGALAVGRTGPSIIALPGETVGGNEGAGSITLWVQSATGFNVQPMVFDQDHPDIPETAEPGDGFGYAVAAW